MTDDEYQCYKCREVFKKPNDERWNDEIAMQEYRTLYPETIGEPLDQLCDLCNEEFKIWFSKRTDDEKKCMRENK